MAKQTTVWQVWESSDMANSDTFWPTKGDALDHLRGAYDVTPGMLKPDAEAGWLEATVPGDGENGFEVYLQKHEIPLNAAGIAWALKHLPNR